MKNYQIKLLTLALFLLIKAKSSSAQTTVFGKVVDAVKAAPIVKVSIKVVNQNIVVSTDKNGEFRFKISKINSNDSLQISSVGYKSIIIAIKNATSGQTFKLEEKTNQLEDVNVKRRKVKLVTLNRFSRGRFLNYNTQAEVAQSFSLDEGSWQLKNIKFNYDFHYYGHNTTSLFNPYSTFVINVYEGEEGKNIPGQKLRSYTIETNSKSKDIVNIDVDSLFFTTNKFYISIQKLYIPKNERYTLDESVHKLGDIALKAVYTIEYEPTLYINNKAERTMVSKSELTGKWAYIDKGAISISPTLLKF